MKEVLSIHVDGIRVKYIDWIRRTKEINWPRWNLSEGLWQFAQNTAEHYKKVIGKPKKSNQRYIEIQKQLIYEGKLLRKIDSFIFTFTTGTSNIYFIWRLCFKQFYIVCYIPYILVEMTLVENTIEYLNEMNNHFKEIIILNKKEYTKWFWRPLSTLQNNI
jgi:hypothetical protein